MKEKNLHSKNKFNTGYDFDALIKINPKLESFVSKNQFDVITIDFSNPEGVKELNKALLFSYDTISVWDFPIENSCPPLPWRFDSLHCLADLIVSDTTVHILEIVTAALCIYHLS